MEQDSNSLLTSQLGRLISRTAPPPKKRRRLESLSPTRLIVSSFLVVIVTGALLLMLPFATRNGITPVQAFFTATSATCVAGLLGLDT